MLSSCPWPAFSSSSRDSHFSQIQIYSFLKLCRRFQSQVKSGLKTTDLGAHGHLHSEITSCMVDVDTQTWMFSLPRTLTTGPFIHSAAACYSLQWLIAGPLILIFLVWTSDLWTAWLLMPGWFIIFSQLPHPDFHLWLWLETLRQLLIVYSTNCWFLNIYYLQVT